MSEWIKCTEKWPELTRNEESDEKENISEDVLLLDSGGYMFVGYLTFVPITLKTIKANSFWSERSTGCGCCLQKLTPTYWMPLPHPPIEEN